jgi:hypothetical protein
MQLCVVTSHKTMQKISQSGKLFENMRKSFLKKGDRAWSP